MEEMDLENLDLGKIKEILKYLVTQEKIRAEEVASLKEMIVSVDSFGKEYVDGQNFKEFKNTYGERLEPYNGTFKQTEGEDFDMTRSAYDGFKELGDENVSQEDYVNIVVEEADKYIANLKASLGLPEEAKVEVTDDGNGNVEVKADVDGDGQTEPVSEETTAEETQVTGEEKTAENPTTEEDDGIDEAVDNYKPNH